MVVEPARAALYCHESRFFAVTTDLLTAFRMPIKLRELGQLCRRLATSLEAGLDLRKVIAREAGGRASRDVIEHMEHLRIAINSGRGFADAVEQEGNFFPPLFREMVRVGEETGKLPEVCRHLAEHYELQLQMRRNFVATITWPVTQLTIAILIVGFVIWIMGVIGDMTGSAPIDIIGFGMTGNRGAAVYFATVGLLVFAGFVAFRAISRGQLWARPIERLVRAIPVLGASLRTLALSRLAWAMHLTLDTGMDLKRALPLSLRSSRDSQIAGTSDAIVLDIRRGRDITEAMSATGVFPRDFLDAVDIGERSGRLPESLGLLSQQYQDQARRALATLTTLAGFAVWALVATFIILMIFRIFSFYLNTINEAVRGL